MDYENLSLGQALRKWPRVSLYSLAVSLNILLWGYDSAIVGNAASMPVFQQGFGVRSPSGGETEYIIPSVWLSLWALGLPVGGMIGSVAAGWIQDWIGRKKCILLGGFVSVAAIAICYVADLAANPDATYFGGKLVEGVAVGIIMCTTQTYLSEIVPPRLRGPAMSLFTILQLLGQLIAAGVVLGQLSDPGKTSYRIAIASEWVLSLAPLSLGLLLPESPAWLLSRGQFKLAQVSFSRLHGPKHVQHQDLFDDMSSAVAQERLAARERTATYTECIQKTNLRRTLIVAFANTISELFGLTLLGHVSYFVQLIGLSADTAFIILISGVILSLVSNGISLWTTIRYGRRLLILSTMAVATVLWLSVGIAGCFSSTTVAYYTAAAMVTVNVIVGLGAWPASYIVASETSSLRLRSKTQGIGWLSASIIRCIFGVVVPYLYGPDAADLGAKIGFIFFATSALGYGVTWAVVPELKGRSVMEVDNLFESHLPARAFKKTGIESLGTSEAGVSLHRLSDGSTAAMA